MDTVDDVNGLSERAKRYFFFSSQHVESVDNVECFSTYMLKMVLNLKPEPVDALDDFESHQILWTLWMMFQNIYA